MRGRSSAQNRSTGRIGEIAAFSGYRNTQVSTRDQSKTFRFFIDFVGTRQRPAFRRETTLHTSWMMRQRSCSYGAMERAATRGIPFLGM
jgi:hypothetical protein